MAAIFPTRMEQPLDGRSSISLQLSSSCAQRAEAVGAARLCLAEHGDGESAATYRACIYQFILGRI
jgi:hypothetical protein